MSSLKGAAPLSRLTEEEASILLALAMKGAYEAVEIHRIRGPFYDFIKRAVALGVCPAPLSTEYIGSGFTNVKVTC